MIKIVQTLDFKNYTLKKMEELVYVQTVYYHCDNSPRNSLDVILVFIQEHPFPCIEN